MVAECSMVPQIERSGVISCVLQGPGPRRSCLRSATRRRQLHVYLPQGCAVMLCRCCISLASWSHDGNARIGQYSFPRDPFLHAANSSSSSDSLKALAMAADSARAECTSGQPSARGEQLRNRYTHGQMETDDVACSYLE